MTGPAPWRPTAAALSWGAVGVVTIALGVLTGRPTVPVLGLPLLLGLAWATARRPATDLRPGLRGSDHPAAHGRIRATVALPPVPEAALVGLRLTALGHRRVEVLLRHGSRPRTVGVAAASVRTGRRELFRLDHRAASADGLWANAAESLEPLEVTVLPGIRPLGELPLPFRLHGLTGPHRSRRVGDEAEPRDVALFGPGDRTRRIDWRVTSRLNAGPALAGRSRISQLYVRRSFAAAEATVMLVIDSRDQVGPRVVHWADASRLREDEATSLDIARSAAASLAARYLAGGDRVGLEDLGRFRRPSPPAGGRHHQQRLLQRLALAEPEGEPAPRRRVPRLPSGCLIVVLSTFLDDDPADMALAWRGAGHRVLAVDTLPRLSLSGATPRLLVAYRLLAMERDDRLTALRRAGVECFGWVDEGGADPAVRLSAAARTRDRR